MADTDLTSRIAELAALIEAQLADDETTAMAASLDVRSRTWTEGLGGYPVLGYLVDDGWGRTIVSPPAPDEAQTRHIARNDPARRLRDVGATRDLVAAILAEPHADSERDSLHTCSQVIDPYLEPLAAVRVGKPCDCGRDSRVARLLGIIASEWEETP